MKEYKQGRPGNPENPGKGGKVKSRKQAVAIAMHESGQSRGDSPPHGAQA